MMNKAQIFLDDVRRFDVGMEAEIELAERERIARLKILLASLEKLWGDGLTITPYRPLEPHILSALLSVEGESYLSRAVEASIFGLPLRGSEAFVTSLLKWVGAASLDPAPLIKDIYEEAERVFVAAAKEAIELNLDLDITPSVDVVRDYARSVVAREVSHYFDTLNDEQKIMHIFGNGSRLAEDTEDLLLRMFYQAREQYSPLTPPSAKELKEMIELAFTESNGPERTRVAIATYTIGHHFPLAAQDMLDYFYNGSDPDVSRQLMKAILFKHFSLMPNNEKKRSANSPRRQR